MKLSLCDFIFNSKKHFTKFLILEEEIKFILIIRYQVYVYKYDL